MISVITDCDHFSGDKVSPRLGQKLVLSKQIRTSGHLLYITFVKDHSPPTFHETFALNGPEACVLPSLLNQQIKSFKSGVKDKIAYLKIMTNSSPIPFQICSNGNFSNSKTFLDNTFESKWCSSLKFCSSFKLWHGSYKKHGSDVCYNSALSQCCSSI